MTKTFRKLLSLLLTTVLILSSYAPVMAAESDGGYIFGSAEYYSTYTPGKLLADSFYYSCSPTASIIRMNGLRKTHLFKMIPSLSSPCS